jgi:hypothetical protein
LAFRNEKDINENFGVHSLPTVILIDPNGLVIGRFVDDEAGMNLLLRKIFGN